MAAKIKISPQNGAFVLTIEHSVVWKSGDPIGLTYQRQHPLETGMPKLAGITYALTLTNLPLPSFVSAPPMSTSPS